MTYLSDYVSVKRRYYRSINLERDLHDPDSVKGYIPTSRAIDGLSRFAKNLSKEHSVRAWTLTGAYGTGKSSFAHFLTCLCGDENQKTKKIALEILQQHDGDGELSKLFKDQIPGRGLLRAIATAQREPVSNTIVRAIHNGATSYWENTLGRKPDVLSKIETLSFEAAEGLHVNSGTLVEFIKELNRASKTGILIIIDELGKNLEFSAQNQTVDDLYLLQQIAELPPDPGGAKVSIYGMLHQSFADYANTLVAEQRKEWAKIQGRFEDIPFVESSDRMVKLIGSAIQADLDSSFQNTVNNWTDNWHTAITKNDALKTLSNDDISAVCPLHPLTAFALPILCSKFSQNDRTLFTFLSSEEPNSFPTFLKNTRFEEGHIETLKLFNLYDYFVESAGISLSMRPQFQKWVEVNNRISDAKYLEPDLVNILKTIGILNLISTTGIFRASKETVSLAMSDAQEEFEVQDCWENKINRLLKNGFLTWRKQIDELRIWEGSEFDIETEISSQNQMQTIGLAYLLNKYFPVGPLIAQRHSYETGTLRYFERVYFDDIEDLKNVDSKNKDSDGLIVYWLGKSKNFDLLGGIPEKTFDGRPVLIICASDLKLLRSVCHEYVALKEIQSNSKELQSDGVARKEVSQRLLYSERMLEEALVKSFDFSSDDTKSYCMGEDRCYHSWRNFQNDLSSTLDCVYNSEFRLWNELLNRRDLSSQGAAARHKLITAMIENSGMEQLGIEGFGPEYSMFDSILMKPGIYREDNGCWRFKKPYQSSGVYNAWKEIESFCKDSVEKPRNIIGLFEILSKPPFGIKNGPIPILLASVLLYYSEQVSVYIDGNFIPSLGSEHFELFYRKPDRFSVKFFEINGLRAQLFQELEGVFSINKADGNYKHRNQTILSIVKPLINFVRSLPEYTLNSEESLSGEAKAVRDAIIRAQEPDFLLFEDLPAACNLPAITCNDIVDKDLIKQFRSSLSKALKELQSRYLQLLEECKTQIFKTFKVQSDATKIREDLRVRASYLIGQVIENQLSRFIYAAADEEATDRSWLESLVMILADKSPRVWKDVDKIVFESKLNDIARRFKNLEVLQKAMANDSRTGFVARKVTLTKPNGRDIAKVVWIDTDQREKLEKIAQNFYDENEDLMEALTAILVERTYKEGEIETKNEIDYNRKVKRIAKKNKTHSWT